MKLAPFTILLFLIWISIGILDQTLEADLSQGNSNSNIFIRTIVQPDKWTDSSFLKLFLGISFVALGISVAATLFSKSDLTLLFVVFTAFISMGSLPIINLYNFLSRNVGMYACTVGAECYVSNLIAGIIAGGLGLYWIFTCLAWWAWRETS